MNTLSENMKINLDLDISEKEVATSISLLKVNKATVRLTSWPKLEIQTTDVKIQKLLTMHGGLDPKSRFYRLYTKRTDSQYDQGVCSSYSSHV